MSYFHLVEAHTINLDKKNMKIGIFTGGTNVRSKNNFTAISRYPTRKHKRRKLLHVTVFHRMVAILAAISEAIGRGKPNL